MIVLVPGGAPELVERIRDARADGQIPLVADERWPRAQRDAVREAAGGARPSRDIAWATLTSGSTGAPRLVLRTASSWEQSFAAVTEILGATHGGAVALPVPPSASLTLFSIAHGLAGGPRPALGAGGVHVAGVTSLHATPQTLARILDAGAPTALRSALVGGSHLDPELRRRAEAAGIRVVSYYGAAELSFVALDHGDGLRAFPGVDIDVRHGVLWVRSPFISSGYAGAAGPLRREGAWASVGDRAELIDGRLRLLGRADDAILSASATIVPDEVEAMLRTVPGIRDAVVFGLPAAHVGALVAALVEVEGGALPHDLRHRITAALAPAHRPRRWFSGVVPRTSSGKPARAEAIRRVADGEVTRLDV
ncbi:AMP-binding protein [Microbacterium aureliae]